MATVKKIRKAEDGDKLRGCKTDSKGNKSCGPVGQGSSALSGKTPRVSKKEQKEADRESLRIMMKRETPISTAPGIRGEKKGSQSFFGGDKDVNEAKYGKKVAKKSASKKAKVGVKIKSKKK